MDPAGPLFLSLFGAGPSWSGPFAPHNTSSDSPSHVGLILPLHQLHERTPVMGNRLLDAGGLFTLSLHEALARRLGRGHLVRRHDLDRLGLQGVELPQSREIGPCIDANMVLGQLALIVGGGDLVQPVSQHLHIQQVGLAVLLGRVVGIRGVVPGDVDGARRVPR